MRTVYAHPMKIDAKVTATRAADEANARDGDGTDSAGWKSLGLVMFFFWIN